MRPSVSAAATKAVIQNATSSAGSNTLGSQFCSDIVQFLGYRRIAGFLGQPLAQLALRPECLGFVVVFGLVLHFDALPKAACRVWLTMITHTRDSPKTV